MTLAPAPSKAITSGPTSFSAAIVDHIWLGLGLEGTASIKDPSLSCVAERDFTFSTYIVGGFMEVVKYLGTAIPSF